MEGRIEEKAVYLLPNYRNSIIRYQFFLQVGREAHPTHGQKIFQETDSAIVT